MKMYFLTILVVLAPVPLLVGAQTAPNIVLLFGDDLGRYASVYRDPARPSPNDILNTPNMDRIAREGTTFWNAFVSVPSCTPSRAALISGRHFFRNGSHSQLHSPWQKGTTPDPWEKVVGFPLMLKEQGYHIGWSYKMHISEDRMGGSGRNYRKAGSRFNNFSENVTAAKNPVTEKEKLLGEVRKNASDFLADRKPDQPFFYWFNPTNTHRTWEKGSGKAIWGLNPESLKGKLPKFLPDEPEIREDVADYLGEVLAFDAAVGVILDELKARGLLENTLVVVSGDHGIPGFTRGKTNLYDFGTQVPLLMRYPGKIAAGKIVRQPVSLIDLAPTFLELAGLKPTPDMNGQNLLPLAKSTSAKEESGGRGYVLTGRETHFHTARGQNLSYPSRAIRTPEYLYIINFKADRFPMGDAKALGDGPIPTDKALEFITGLGYADLDAGPFKAWLIKHKNDPAYGKYLDWAVGKRPEEELYLVTEDPDQLVNLAASSSHQAIRKDLRGKLLEILKANDDPRLKDAFDKPPYLVGAPRQGK
ncbi:MAG: sulfatase [Gemmataceae bacterium]